MQTAQSMHRGRERARALRNRRGCSDRNAKGAEIRDLRSPGGGKKGDILLKGRRKGADLGALLKYLRKEKKEGGDGARIRWKEGLVCKLVTMPTLKVKKARSKERSIAGD